MSFIGSTRMLPQVHNLRTSPGPPMTLANMRSLGVRDVHAWCHCGHHASVNVDRLGEDVAVPSLTARLRCARCGARPHTAHPDWLEQRNEGMGYRANS